MAEDYLEQMVLEDVRKVLGAIRPRALFLCMLADFWLGFLIFCPLSIAGKCWQESLTFPGSPEVGFFNRTDLLLGLIGPT